MLAHVYACAYKDTYTWTNYVFRLGSHELFLCKVNFVHQCGVQSSYINEFTKSTSKMASSGRLQSGPTTSRSSPFKLRGVVLST